MFCTPEVRRDLAPRAVPPRAICLRLGVRCLPWCIDPVASPMPSPAQRWRCEGCSAWNAAGRRMCHDCGHRPGGPSTRKHDRKPQQKQQPQPQCVSGEGGAPSAQRSCWACAEFGCTSTFTDRATFAAPRGRRLRSLPARAVPAPHRNGRRRSRARSLRLRRACTSRSCSFLRRRSSRKLWQPLGRRRRLLRVQRHRRYLPVSPAQQAATRSATRWSHGWPQSTRPLPRLPAAQRIPT